MVLLCKFFWVALECEMLDEWAYLVQAVFIFRNSARYLKNLLTRAYTLNTRSPTSLLLLATIIPFSTICYSFPQFTYSILRYLLKISV